jgi:hypothetical protein
LHFSADLPLRILFPIRVVKNVRSLLGDLGVDGDAAAALDAGSPVSF